MAVILVGVFVVAHSPGRIRPRLAPYDLATMKQDPSFDQEQFTEERLAKALNDLYAAGLNRLMSSRALKTIRQHRLETRFGISIPRRWIFMELMSVKAWAWWATSALN